MCGIFGIIASKDSPYNKRFLKRSLTYLSRFSETRGKDSSGICFHNNDAFDIIKGSIPVSKLLKSRITKSKFSEFLDDSNKIRLAFGHSRLVTNGSQVNNFNNQPVVKDDIIAIHNGIIVNSNDLWNNDSNLKKIYDIDTEIFLSLLRSFLKKGNGIRDSVKKTFNLIKGTASLAMAFTDIHKFVLTTNNGSLYFINNKKNDIIIFASELSILNKLNSKINLKNYIGNFNISKLDPEKIIEIDLENFSVKENFLNIKNEFKEKYVSKRVINTFVEETTKTEKSLVLDLNELHLLKDSKRESKLLIYPLEEIQQLKRCKKCILPETFPYIKYNSDGVCNYCENHTPKSRLSNIDDLVKLVEPYKRKNGKPDCIIPFSGGRDSMYTLHIVKKELGLNPITFTYDWGMVTDLARRNIARICGELGIENITVAADIRWKRENIRKNIIAWLKYPKLGMIPLFMAGDKFFFYHTNKLQKETGIDLNIWGINDLENTDFKTGFGGLKPEFNKEIIYSLSLKNKLNLFKYVTKNILASPGYINQSVFDSLGSFASRYFIKKRHYYHLFDYIQWDEKVVEETIINNYNWETCLDTKSTWRIGDGTASFYNYIYTLVAGFSENDTFRSNQIREGQITREEALNRIYEENMPRYNSIKWYLEILNLDFEDTIKTINKIKKNYN